jgi:predicted transposase YbfD/YdcC
VIGDVSLVERAVAWALLQGLVRIEAQCYHKRTGKTEREIRYYITSLKPDAAGLNRVVPQHWGIENKLDWVFDVGFGDDLSRKRPARPRRTSPYSIESLSTLSNRKNHPNVGSKEIDSKPQGIILPAQITRNLICVALGGQVQESLCTARAVLIRCQVVPEFP